MSLAYDYQAIWTAIDLLEPYIPSRRQFPGSPYAYKVVQYIMEQAKTQQLRSAAVIGLLGELKAQLEFNLKYEHDNFERLR